MRSFYLTMVRLMVIGAILILILIQFTTWETKTTDSNNLFLHDNEKEKVFLIKEKGEEKGG